MSFHSWVLGGPFPGLMGVLWPPWSPPVLGSCLQMIQRVLRVPVIPCPLTLCSRVPWIPGVPLLQVLRLSPSGCQGSPSSGIAPIHFSHPRGLGAPFHCSPGVSPRPMSFPRQYLVIITWTPKYPPKEGSATQLWGLAGSKHPPPKNQALLVTHKDIWVSILESANSTLHKK